MSWHKTATLASTTSVFQQMGEEKKEEKKKKACLSLGILLESYAHFNLYLSVWKLITWPHLDTRETEQYSFHS